MPVVTCSPIISVFFFFNDTATTEIYTLSLHDALPISPCRTASSLVSRCSRTIPRSRAPAATRSRETPRWRSSRTDGVHERSEEHTSELQSRLHLVCRLLLEKKKKHKQRSTDHPRVSRN